MSAPGLTPRKDSVSLLPQLNDREPQVVGHPAVSELLGLLHAPLVGGTRLVLAPQTLQNLAETSPGVALVLVSVPRRNEGIQRPLEGPWPCGAPFFSLAPQVRG
jgi:hypothetical protein